MKRIVLLSGALLLCGSLAFAQQEAPKAKKEKEKKEAKAPKGKAKGKEKKEEKGEHDDHQMGGNGQQGGQMQGGQQGQGQQGGQMQGGQQAPPASPAAEANGRMLMVKYSSPRMKGRKIFAADGLVPYGKVWRTGANATTHVVVIKKIMFGGQVVEPGSYGLFTIPGESQWTVMLTKPYNNRPDFKEAEVVVRIMIAPKQMANAKEEFTILVQPMGEMEHMLIQWDRTEINIPIVGAN